MEKKRQETRENPLFQAATVIHDFQFSQRLNSEEICSVQTQQLCSLYYKHILTELLIEYTSLILVSSHIFIVYHTQYTMSTTVEGIFSWKFT